MYVLGRPPNCEGATGHLGTYRARDGSDGARVGVDLERPHAAVVVGKRGHGKSHTLGVLAEAASRARGVAPVVADPTGALAGLADGEGDAVQSEVVRTPTIRPDALAPPAWPDLFGRSRTDAVGTLLWQAAAEAGTLDGMAECVASTSADPTARRAARNHLDLAASWGVFDPAGLSVDALFDGAATVLDLSGLDDAPANALVRGVTHALYRRRLDDGGRLPWLLLDEAHVFFDGVAAPALETVLRRGRGVGVSLVAATQRPSAVPEVALSQADLLVAHRLTAGADVAALVDAAPTYLEGSVGGRLPTRAGDALVVDDVTESVHEVRVRDRTTPHRGASPRASAAVEGRADEVDTYPSA